nr:exopolysaccharide biosynthesis polyprenyl glycosylphosphotransferase [uncultured Brevundimonas sp.]
MTDCASHLADSLPAPTEKTAKRAERGPFRTELWLSARQRSDVRLAAHYFRVVDVLTVFTIGLAVAYTAAPNGLGALSLAVAAPSLTAGVVILSLMRGLNLYGFRSNREPLIHLASIIGLALVAAGGAFIVSLLFGDQGLMVAGVFILATAAALLALHSVWLAIVARWRKKGVLSPNIVIVGATRNAEILIQRALERRDLNVLGLFDDRLARSPKNIGGVPMLGDANALINHRMTPYVDHIVLAIDAHGGERVRDLTRRLESLPNALTVLVEGGCVDAALDRLASAPLAPLGGPAHAERKAFNKRMLDVVVGLIALIAAAPVMALVALAIRLDSPGPIFFRQRRHGFNQEEIVVWKFRSMRHVDADATASRQVTADDCRVTRVGRFIRATSLDELPQIFNILTGEMSLVGPRPHAIGMKTGDIESARLVAEYAHRHRIKPGMTGWAAVKGSRGPVNTEQEVRRRVQLDIDYIERQSLWLDLWVILITLPVLLGDRSAVR